MGWSYLNSLGASGKQIIGWRDNIFYYSSELVGKFLFSVKVIHHRTGKYFVIISVYGSCYGDTRQSSGKIFEAQEVRL